MKFINSLGYNSLVILTFFFISLFALVLKYVTGGKSNKIFPLLSPEFPKVFRYFPKMRSFLQVSFFYTTFATEFIDEFVWLLRATQIFRQALAISFNC